ncbi:MAG TPA: hypothetical protein VJL29_06155 [Thermoguttaceae bacterium]|nr:hypothetical protein [Thermoguttaceae bacterium]
MSSPLLPPRSLFRFSIPCRHGASIWTAKGTSLGPECALPNFAELEQPGAVPEVRVGWNASGLALRFEIHGKRQDLWCRAKMPDESDGVQIWLDTRDVKTVHRAGRFCHRLFFLPGGGGRDQSQPVAGTLPISRAKELHAPIHESQLKVLSQKRAGGYILHICISADALTGFDPDEHPRLGFTYAVFDRELGEHTLAAGGETAYREDPSLWATLELMRE